MRKIVAGLFMSLDGVVESPEEWAYQYANDQMWAGGRPDRASRRHTEGRICVGSGCSVLSQIRRN